MPSKTLFAAAVLASTTLVSGLNAAAITSGDVLIYRVGTGASALNTFATAVFIDEYNLNGGFVQSIPLATSGTSALTASGSASTEGEMGLSGDGSRIVFGGYRAATTINADPSASAGTTYGRVLATMDLTGTANTATAVTDTGTNTLRSVATVNGSSFYVGTSAAVRYASTAAGTTTGLIETRNTRQVLVNGSTLYASSGSGTASIPKVYSYAPLPTTTGPGAGVATFPTSADAAQGIYFADLDPTVAGADTLYVINVSRSQLLKYTFNGTAWSVTSTLDTFAGQNITGVVGPDGAVNLFFTTASSLQRITDASGYGGVLGYSTGNPAVSFAQAGGTTIASAGSLTAFRGLAILPEPTTLTALGGIVSLVVARRCKA